MLPYMRGLWQFRSFIRFLTLKQLRLRYRGSAIGFLWTLLNPLLTILIYSFAFLVVLRVSSVDNFRLYLIVGILHWHYFAIAVSSGVNAIVDNGGILQSVNFPRSVLPVSTVVAALVEQGLALIALAPVFLWMDGVVWWGLILYPLVLLMFYVSIAGTVSVLAALTVFFRDMQQIVDVLLKILFWLTPIVFTFDFYPENVQAILRFSPVTIFLRTIEDLLVFGDLPSMGRWAAMVLSMVVPATIAAWTYRRFQGLFAERI